ncbi:hypothetical protein [Streptomyces sp. NBC_01446]|uniref:Uncharacterized protein n=1 Tax=Streptomyces sp. NBC_00119 TaxID=2975659 RepID=A0AAU1ULB7_9ACTN|nr:hypothetical protein [Streptomyces sp. NBC_01446]MCX4649641.1 hypothetical protein [Streptomyces sp. NBC_01446]
MNQLRAEDEQQLLPSAVELPLRGGFTTEAGQLSGPGCEFTALREVVGHGNPVDGLCPFQQCAVHLPVSTL